MRKTGSWAGDAALIGQPAEGARDKEGRMGITTRETTASTTRWNSSSTWVMTLARVQVAARPTSTEKTSADITDMTGSDVQVEQQLRRLPQPLRCRLDGQAGDDGVAGPH